MKVLPYDDAHVIFQRIYIYLGACKNGFKNGCRQLVGLDGCHLKGVFKGQLLSPVGMDANNQTWVIAYAIVELENKDSWVWFLELLAADLGIVNQPFEKVLPNCNHRFCVRHLYTNYKADGFKWKGLKDALWNAAKATTIADFRKSMAEVNRLNEKAYKWLEKRPALHWSRSHFDTHTQCDILLNNLCESFNSFILRSRDKPIITMLETIRVLLMKRIWLRRDAMRKDKGAICPKIQKKLKEYKLKSSHTVATWSGGENFEVDEGRSNKMGFDRLSLHSWLLGHLLCKETA
ncbi:uncharacterized protein LOC126625551 [Malus sylvestris]|uniref:uncharacterized protein LOC126625551 n=1 Tax=Malus sylvestris TaxID=3752 RepID=UPI0021ACCB98|nr:uncharacterized protein LOC126625551 [Malus sylvestris]